MPVADGDVGGSLAREGTSFEQLLHTTFGELEPFAKDGQAVRSRRRKMGEAEQLSKVFGLFVGDLCGRVLQRSTIGNKGGSGR